MSDYSPQQATALKLLKAKGQEMTLVRIAMVNYDPVNPTATEPAAVLQCAAVGVVLPSNPSTITIFGLDERMQAEPQLRQSFRYLLLAAGNLEFPPQLNDVLITKEAPYRIIGLTTLDPNGEQPILYSVGAMLDTQVDLSGLEEETELILDGQI